MRWYNVCKIDGGYYGETRQPGIPQPGERVGLFGSGEIVTVDHVDSDGTIWIK